MRGLSETRSSDDLPREMRDLSTRQSLGRAAEILALWRSTGAKPEGAATALRSAGTQLAMPTVSGTTAESARPLGSYRPQIQLLAHAQAAFPSEGLNRLREVSDLLDSLARIDPAPSEELDSVIEKLGQLRRVMSGSPSRPVERRSRDRRR